MSLGHVLLVPGFGGSELWADPNFPYTPLGRPIWFKVGAILDGQLEFLSLAPDGATRIKPVWPTISARAWVTEFYGNWSKRYWWYSYQPHVFFYDFRLDIIQNSVKLLQWIQAHPEYYPLRCAGHSLGGVLLRLALTALSASGGADAIHSAVALGAPHRGSWVITRLLSATEGNVWWLNFGARAGFLPWNLLKKSFFTAIAGTWPATYQLLPHFYTEGAAVAYNPANYGEYQSFISPAWLSATIGYWPQTIAAPPNINWWDFGSEGFDTPEALKEGFTFDQQDALIQGQGDGTVTRDSSFCQGSHRVLAPVGHSAWITDQGVFDAVHSIFQTGTYLNASTSGAPADDPAIF